ncbi:GGDEF domain-containing protein [Thermocrinis sp.]
MLKRKILIRVFLSFLVTFLPTVLLLYLLFQRISKEALIKERDALYNNFKILLEQEIKYMSLDKKLFTQDGYYITLKVHEECKGEPHYRIVNDSIYYGKRNFLDKECYFLGVNLEELSRLMNRLTGTGWLIYYDRLYIDKLPQEFLDGFVRDKVFKDDVVIAGFSDKELLGIPLEVKGYTIYGNGWKKNLIVEFPIFDSNGYQFGKTLLVKDVSSIYTSFYTLMAVLVGYSFMLSLFSSALLYKLSEDLVNRIIEIQKFSSKVKRGEFSQAELFKNSKEEDELDHLRRDFVDAALTIGKLLSELELKNKELQELAYNDPLTGLPNRRFFFEHANLIFEEAKRYEKKLSLLVMDIDHFKKINDTYGHDVGDLVLKTFAGLLKGLTRKFDICARMGGEEFAVLLPNTGLDGARTLAERIRNKLASTPIEHGEAIILVTTSIGVSEFRKGMESIDELIKEADMALYKAKEGGRNRVEVFSPDKT